MNFKKSFSTYDENAYVQRDVAKKLITFLKKIEVNSQKKVLEIGCGTGLLTREYLKYFAPETLVLNDICDAREYLKGITYDEFILGDIEKISLPESDMIISSSVFQWLKNFSKTMEYISKTTHKLCFSMYLEGNLEEIKEHFGISLKYLTLDNIVEILTSLFSKVKWKEEVVEMSFSTPMEALRHLKNTGVTGFDRSSIGKIRSYESRVLTYKVGYFYCEK